MGNYVSCTLSTPLGKSSKATKVILPSGEIRQFNEPIKAAELMLETPNFFLVNSQSLKLGCRFSPLHADEDLEFANVYVMFPMKRVNSTVTAGDMGALFLAANSAAKKGFGGEVRILPEAEEANLRDVSLENIEETEKMPKLNLDDIEEFSTPGFMHRLSMSRSKKPLLETIAEEPVRAR
ncbi:PADRE domain - like 10 [Theobroma cacao]|nr:PADRE domain - like 10 [Theobroma cacao]